MKVERKADTLEIDIHGMRKEDAMFRIETLLDNVSPNIKEIRIIHGYNNGTALRDMVRGFKHPKIKMILRAYTDGQTRFIL